MKTPPPNVIPTEKKERCLRAVLKPLARFCLRNAYSFQEFTKVAKLVFIEAAAEEIQKTTTKINPSRISVMTGIYRREVTKIYREKEEPSERQPAILGRVLTQWQEDPQFQDQSGKPKPLGWRGKESEFATLVEKVSKHVPVGSVIFEMTRLGIVEKTSDEVILLRRLSGAERDLVDGYELLGRELETVVRTAEENISRQRGFDNLHIRTEFDNVVQAALPMIREWLIEEGKQFQIKVRSYLAQFDKDVQSTAAFEKEDRGGGRVVVSLFGRTSSTEDQQSPE